MIFLAELGGYCLPSGLAVAVLTFAFLVGNDEEMIEDINRLFFSKGARL